MFENSLLDRPTRNRVRRSGSLFISLLIQTFLIAVVVIVPLPHMEALPEIATISHIFAPRVPAAASPSAERSARLAAVRPGHVILRTTPRTRPVASRRPAPDPNALISPFASPPDVTGIPFGLPAGFGPGGSDTFVMGDNFAPPPPDTAPVQTEPYQVGGHVLAPRLIHQTQPVYPPLARQARIQGTVHLEAVITRHGAISRFRAVSGHPLLVQAALAAVEQWRYEPALLNGTPVDVITTVEVNFRLAR